MSDFLGRWTNELGSELSITGATALRLPSSTLDHTIIEGNYRTRVGVENNGEFFPVTGFITSHLITFSVSFNRIDADGEHRSTCTWAGQYLPDQRPDGGFDPGDPLTVMKTIWHLVPTLTGVDDSGTYGWLIAHSGSNEFRKVP